MHTALALKGEAAQRVAVVAELLVQRLDGVQQRLSLLGVPGRCFTDKQRGIDGVLVADVCAGQVAVALLKAEDIAVGAALGFQPADLFTDELKAGQGAAQLDAVFFATGAAISVETIVVTATGSAGIVPSARRVRQM